MSRILYSENISVNFDGFLAIDSVSFHLEYGELRFLIGPNGAGKTTLLDVICGKVKPVKGRMIFQDRFDITKSQEHQIVRHGIGRKFQTPAIFSELSVFENLELSLKQDRGLWASLRASLSSCQQDQIMNMLETIGLADKRGMKAGALSHGEKQWLEIGMLLMQDPKLLLLDEPVAGMTKKETEKTGELLQEIAKNRSVLVVDHDMDFVRKFATKVTVMHEGKILREGNIEEVQQDPRVAEIYLGKRREAYANHL